jgi:hypothetical protein
MIIAILEAFRFRVSVLWDMKTFILVEMDLLVTGFCCLNHQLGIIRMMIWAAESCVCIFLPDYIAAHLRREQIS